MDGKEIKKGIMMREGMDKQIRICGEKEKSVDQLMDGKKK